MFHDLQLSFIFGILFLLRVSKCSTDINCHHERTGSHCPETESQPRNIIGAIGGVIELSSRIGREQQIAMEMALQDHPSNCSKLLLHLRDSHGNAARAVYAVMGLIESKQVQAIIGTLTPQEATMVSEFDESSKDIPIISITPTATPSLPLAPGISSFIQMSHDISVHMQCIAAIVGRFRWRKVTALYQHNNNFGSNPGLLTQLADSLQSVDSVIEYHSAFPPMHSLSNPKAYIENELEKLRSKSNRVFILIQSSLNFAILLFEKANQMGMMENGYVWIVSDDTASLLDSVGLSVISNMQGVIGFKTKFVDTTETFRDFKLGFRRKYREKYPNEEEYSNPSIYALQAYDATLVIARSMHKLQGFNSSQNLTESILGMHAKGLSGEISFKKGKLAPLPTFRIINVIGRSYREIALWSPKFGFSGIKEMRMSRLEDELDSINWPGGVQTVPTGWVLGEKEKPLKIGVPARGAFNQFVKVIYDQERNRTYVTGFSIEVFEAAVKQLPYPLPYVFIPYYGTYDEMVAEVYNKSLDAAVGDTEIMADRYQYVEFSQPYMESGLDMVVTVKPDTGKGRFIVLYAFTTKMWVLMATMAICTGSVVWLHEHVTNNQDFVATSFIECIGKMLWFSVTVMTFAQRELIKSNLSRLVLVVWFCVNVIVAACFTAELSSIMTVSRFLPTISDIEYLQRTNAAVGCNGNSFIVRYLVHVLHFKPENIRRIDSIKDYPLAFKSGDIAAAFFVAPHAKVFLAEYCQGYTRTGASFKLGGFGFVFQKGSRLAEDMSEAILKVTQRGEINQMEKHMLSFSNCSSSSLNDSAFPGDIGLGPGPLSGVFIISGCISALVLLVTIARVALESWIWNFISTTLANRRTGNWIALLLSRFYKPNQVHVHPEASSIELSQVRST